MKIKLTYLFLLASLVSQAQLFKGLGFVANRYIGAMYSDTVDNNLYVGGGFRKLNGQTANHFAYYDGTKWNPVPTNGLSDAIGSITRFKGDIYVAGNIGVKRLNGSRLDSLGNSPNPNGYVARLFNFKDSLLFVAGNFTKVDDSIPALGIATWDGTQWDTLPVNVPRVGSTNQFTSIAYYKGEFYFGGNFTGKYGEDIIRFDGKNWKDVGGGLQGDSWILDMEIYRGELYVTGDFGTYSGNADNKIMRWDGTTWKPVGGGFDYQAFDLMVYKNYLFACGQLNHAGGIYANGIARWDGKEWCVYRNNFVNTVGDFAIYRDSLVVSNGNIAPPSQDQVNLLTDITQTFKCGILDGVAELDLPDFKVYPNPVLNELKIEGSGTAQAIGYKLVNMQGQIVQSGSSMQAEFIINTEELVPGIYFLELLTDNKRITKKIVKQ